MTKKTVKKKVKEKTSTIILNWEEWDSLANKIDEYDLVDYEECKITITQPLNGKIKVCVNGWHEIPEYLDEEFEI
jgi:extradiol dioxygenase family protein